MLTSRDEEDKMLTPKELRNRGETEDTFIILEEPLKQRVLVRT